MNRGTRRRAYCAALIVVAAAVASLVGENTRAGDAAVSAPRVEVTSQITAASTVPGAAAGHNAHATLNVVAGKPSPSLFAEIGGTANVRTDKPAVETIDILNAGSGPATTTGGLPSIQLSNLIAPTVIGSWSAKGRGWTCTGASGTAPTCTSSVTVPVGHLAPRLTLTFQLDPTRVAALHLETGGKPSVQRWLVQMTGYGGQTAKSSTTPATMVGTTPPGAPP